MHLHQSTDCERCFSAPLVQEIILHGSGHGLLLEMVGPTARPHPTGGSHRDACSSPPAPAALHPGPTACPCPHRVLAPGWVQPHPPPPSAAPHLPSLLTARCNLTAALHSTTATAFSVSQQAGCKKAAHKGRKKPQPKGRMRRRPRGRQREGPTRGLGHHRAQAAQPRNASGGRGQASCTANVEM